MRRRAATFAWISMLDLLSGVFGALIVLSVMISLKLGTEEPITRRPFHLIAIEMKPVDSPSLPDIVRRFKEAFGETYLAFQLVESSQGNHVGEWIYVGEWSAVASGSDGSQDLARFVSASDATGKVSAALFISEPDEYKGKALRPVLGNLARIEEWCNQGNREWCNQEKVAEEPDLKVRVRLSVKSGASACDPPPFDISVRDLMERGKLAWSRGARIVPDEHLDADAPRETQLVCRNGVQGTMIFRGGAIELQ